MYDCWSSPSWFHWCYCRLRSLWSLSWVLSDFLSVSNLFYQLFQPPTGESWLHGCAISYPSEWPSRFSTTTFVQHILVSSSRLLYRTSRLKSNLWGWSRPSRLGSDRWRGGFFSRLHLSNALMYASSQMNSFHGFSWVSQKLNCRTRNPFVPTFSLREVPVDLYSVAERDACFAQIQLRPGHWTIVYLPCSSCLEKPLRPCSSAP